MHVSFWPFKVNFGIFKAIVELWTCDQQVTAERYTALKQLFIYLMTLTTIRSAVSGKNLSIKEYVYQEPEYQEYVYQRKDNTKNRNWLEQ